MEIKRIRKQVIDFLQSGIVIEKDKRKYMNYPYWVRPLNPSVDDKGEKIRGFVDCEVLTRGEIPEIQAGYKTGGLKARKYIIKKADGSDVDPAAWYFVLRIDKDPHARNAALAYCDSVEQDNTLLAKELREAVLKYKK